MHNLFFKLAHKFSKVGWFKNIYDNGVIDGAYAIALLVKGARPDLYDSLVEFANELIGLPFDKEFVHRRMAMLAFVQANNKEDK